MQLRLTQAIHRARQMRPDGTAVIDRGQTWTWTEYADRIARLGGLFRELGVLPGDRVAMLSLNSHRYLEFYFATLWVGAVIMPLNHRLSASELSAVMDDGEPRVLLVSQDFLDVGRAIANMSKTSPRLIYADEGPTPEGFQDYEAGLRRSPPTAEEPCAADDLACLFYTGGTTGRPKGVMLTHANVFLNSLNLIPEVEMNERSVHLHAGPLFHVAAGVRIYSTSLAGGTHVVAAKFELPDVLDVIERCEVTIATFVPIMLRRILEDETLRGYALPSLRYITYGAAPMPRSLLEQAMTRFASVQFVQSYGMTEASPIVTILSARDHQQAALLTSAGRVALSAEVRIVGNGGEALLPGEVGEIVVRGPMVMKGYWRNPVATAQVLKNGWLHTGDLGRLDDAGYLFVVDRLKDVIITGGENVYSGEVEQVLATHPSISECAVFGLPDATWGEAVHAVVVPQAGATISESDLAAHCRRSLAGYKCPRSIEIRVSSLPVSNVNKVLKAELRRVAMERISAREN